MQKTIFGFLITFFLFTWNPSDNRERAFRITGSPAAVSSPADKDWPDALLLTPFTGPDLTPSPACLAVAATGEVFVGVDMIGSLGKDPGKGRIVRLTDRNHDGKPDAHTIFARVDNPRGIIANGDKVYVLHTVFSEETGKATGMNLVVFEDKNNDGIADGPSKPLIEHISSPKFLQSRGTDHATNGIRMGIDGWIYIAVGDFGFHGAVDRNGKTLTMLGGGIVRVRPDGTEMEVYTHGLRNIYDIAIDPYMNLFTRGNTNDGGGWNVRFSNQIQSGEYGYPVLFKHFTDEIIPALADVGGGSGTGALFMDDDRWPALYNRVPMMADWGRNQLYIHRLEPDQASFRQKEEPFIKLSQVTDLDVDGAGILYLSAWDGAGYSGNPSKGFVVRVVPRGWEYKPVPDFGKESDPGLVELLKSGSGVIRLAAQQELLRRKGTAVSRKIGLLASDETQPLPVRVAALYTYAQLGGSKVTRNLVSLLKKEDMREFALRALADRKETAAKVPVSLFLQALNDPSPRVQAAAIIGLGRIGKAEAANALLNIPLPPNIHAPEPGTEGPHATPHAAVIPAHLAVKSLVALHAVDACVRALGTPQAPLALRALRYMHDPEAVKGLIAAYPNTTAPELRREILTTLSRLYKKEAEYDGSWWWSTRPDTHGPYYKAETWAASEAIRTFLLTEFNRPGADRNFFVQLNSRHRMDLPEMGAKELTVAKEEPKVDLEKIKSKAGQVGDSSIEDVMLAIAKIPGDPAVGKKLFTSQGCIACHSVQKGDVMKGPFMGQIGSIMTREQIAESILKPDASISQGFASVLITARGDKSYVGFITEESAEKIVLRDIAGQVYTVRTADVVSRKELENSMMPAGLANSLSYEEFASLVTFLSQQKK